MSSLYAPVDIDIDIANDQTGDFQVRMAEDINDVYIYLPAYASLHFNLLGLVQLCCIFVMDTC
ncbi:hypothetical protein K474DRAFT_1706424 [Panus rudis PR-1116 ss-1]|nr:hypothetical protein K474DRAFT_1706424 [Panus rudis PR-1116 ss-1]